MPDLAGMMNNPMMMQMAQQLMANGGLERIMSNPAVANMVRSSSSSASRRLSSGPHQMGRVQSGQMPSMEELMSDPTLRNLYVYSHHQCVLLLIKAQCQPIRDR